jgi:transglutaminase-like putative cysteine protease
VFPLSDGNGSYRVGVFRNISGNQFSTEFSTTFTVTLQDEFAPFLRPNQYVNFTPDTIAVREAAVMLEGIDDVFEKIKTIYNFVVAEFSYDVQLAESVTSGYLPDLDRVWRARMGICFDFAAITTAMLRSSGIPTQLVVGYVGDVYHAWINVWVEDEGWVIATIFFDGEAWNLMDPTFAAGASSPERLQRFIGDGSRYVAKFLY